MSAPRDTWKKPPFIANPVLRWAVILGALAYFGWVGTTMPIDWNRVVEGFGRAGRIFGGAFPPSFERSGLLIDGFLESLKIAILATAGGVLLSIPIAFIMPRQIGLTIYQLDSNLRASAVVGIVGAGGIGATLANAFGRYDYDFALAITMVIVGVILVSEAVSGVIRKRIQ